MMQVRSALEEKTPKHFTSMAGRWHSPDVYSQKIDELQSENFVDPRPVELSGHESFPHFADSTRTRHFPLRTEGELQGDGVNIKTWQRDAMICTQHTANQPACRSAEVRLRARTHTRLRFAWEDAADYRARFWQALLGLFPAPASKSFPVPLAYRVSPSLYSLFSAALKRKNGPLWSLLCPHKLANSRG